MPAPDPADPADLVVLAVELAQEAGALLLEGQARVRTTIETKSTGTDMVTEMVPVKHHFDSGVKAQIGIEF